MVVRESGTSGERRVDRAEVTKRLGRAPGMSAILAPPLQLRMGRERQDFMKPIMEPPFLVLSISSPIYTCECMHPLRAPRSIGSS